MLSQNVLSITRPPLDIEHIPNYFNDTNDLIWLTQHCENDAYLSMRLVFQLMVIPLTKQLTNLAGNLWSRTLVGGRAERNEYLLLHEFYKNDYVLPDKSFSEAPVVQKSDKNSKAKKNIKEASKAQHTAKPQELDAEVEDEDDGTILKCNSASNTVDAGETVKKSGRRKPAYAGGLVLEPKKGFYDKFVLMLDFNSLYPSIIREYNICFTTVERKLVGLLFFWNGFMPSQGGGRFGSGGRGSGNPRPLVGAGHLASSFGYFG